jgi:mannose-1-phosphate guanylyltransferase
MSMDIQVVVMAGGSGTRFWPLSRRAKPKQFLPIISSRTMVAETVERLLPLAPWAKIRTVANAQQTRLIRKLLPKIPARNTIVEPSGRNTAPSLMLATAEIYRENPEAAVIVLPSDHLIADTDVFLKQLESGAQAAVKDKRLVTFGIRPTYPATGYGYIHASAEPVGKHKGFPFHGVLEFKEKPDREQAKLFLASGRYYWNSGMFVWTPEVFAAELKAHAPDFHPSWPKLLASLQKRSAIETTRVFNGLPAMSIDYALMEKAQGVLVCPSRFGWSDVGAWSSLLEVWPRDDQRNAAKGETIAVDSEGCLVFNPDKLTALVGVKDLVIVNTGDALLVCRKDRDQQVKHVIAALVKGGRTRYL